MMQKKIYHDQKQPWRKDSSNQFVIPYLIENTAGIQGKDLEARTEAETMEEHASGTQVIAGMVTFSYFSYKTQDCLPIGGTIHNRLVSQKTKIVLIDIPTG